MKLIAGLGNPGREYEGSRHNVGFAALDSLARRYAPGTAAKARFQGSVIETEIGPERVMLLKPLTFMNLSGRCVGEAVRFYKIEPANDVLVLVDDLALPCGSIRMRGDGSAGGHNGLMDIETHLGTSSYARLRIGIDGRGDIPQKHYVLGQFTPDQKPLVEASIAEAAEAAACWATAGLAEAMNRYNTRRNSASEPV